MLLSRFQDEEALPAATAPAEGLMGFLERLWENETGSALAIIVASYFAARIIDWLVKRTLLRLTSRTKTEVDDKLIKLLHGVIVKTVMLVGLDLAAERLAFEASVETVTNGALLTIGLLVWTVFAFRASSLLLKAAARNQHRFRMMEDRTFPLFDNLTKVFLAGLSVYLLIVIWDIDATGWMASAGIIGIAVGFGAQETLANLFAGVFIIADAPYKVADFINLDTGERGQVVHIGLRSTRILTRDDVEITIPNSVMGKAKIINESGGPYKKERIRVVCSTAYGSDVDQVRQVLIDVAKAEEQVCLSPTPRVRFRSFGDSGLNFELLVWIEEPVLRGRVLDALLTDVYKAFGRNGIEIPYPKRDVYIREMPAPKA